MSWIKADNDELKMGVEVEKEHSDTIKWLIEQLNGDPKESQDLLLETIKRIAQDHLKEFETYYTQLKKMEQGG